MNKDLINNLILRESEVLGKLLILLEEQHEMLLKNDIFGLEAIVDRIKQCNREVAEIEVERRKHAKGQSMKELVACFDNIEIDNNYRNIIKLLSELEIQKDINDMLIKQGLGFSTRMMNLMTPNKGAKTYNSYGKMVP
jgi:flagellar biosynthesis/type III secretory pathway chaperone